MPKSICCCYSMPRIEYEALVEKVKGQFVRIIVYEWRRLFWFRMWKSEDKFLCIWVVDKIHRFFARGSEKLYDMLNEFKIVFWCKEGSSDKEFKKGTASCPYVDTLGVFLWWQHNFRSPIEARDDIFSHESRSLFIFAGKSEITESYITCLISEDIRWLNISVYYIPIM